MHVVLEVFMVFSLIGSGIGQIWNDATHQQNTTQTERRTGLANMMLPSGLMPGMVESTGLIPNIMLPSRLMPGMFQSTGLMPNMMIPGGLVPGMARPRGLMSNLRLASFLERSVPRGNTGITSPHYFRQTRVTGVPSASLLVILKALNPDLVADNIILKSAFCSQCHREDNYVCATFYCRPD